MAEIKIGDRPLQATVVKLRAGTENKALSDMTRDGVNNVAFKLDGDTYVATAKGLDLKGVQAWGTISYAGRTGHVLKTDREELKAGAVKRWALVAAGVGLVGMPLTGLGLGVLFEAMPAVADLGIFAGVGGAIGGGIGAAWAALTNWNNGRQAKRDPLAKYAEPASLKA
jgi:hypothetical protein